MFKNLFIALVIMAVLAVVFTLFLACESGYREFYITDDESGENFNIDKVSKPIFDPNPGAYEDAQSITITSYTEGATIRYTTDGSTPTSTYGTIYNGTPIPFDASVTINAIAYKTGMDDSVVVTESYLRQVKVICETEVATHVDRQEPDESYIGEIDGSDDLLKVRDKTEWSLQDATMFHHARTFIKFVLTDVDTYYTNGWEIVKAELYLYEKTKVVDHVASPRYANPDDPSDIIQVRLSPGEWPFPDDEFCWDDQELWGDVLTDIYASLIFDPDNDPYYTGEGWRVWTDTFCYPFDDDNPLELKDLVEGWLSGSIPNNYGIFLENDLNAGWWLWKTDPEDPRIKRDQTNEVEVLFDNVVHKPYLLVTVEKNN
jgi:hypothetical protein